MSLHGGSQRPLHHVHCACCICLAARRRPAHHLRPPAPRTTNLHMPIPLLLPPTAAALWPPPPLLQVFHDLPEQLHELEEEQRQAMKTPQKRKEVRCTYVLA